MSYEDDIYGDLVMEQTLINESVKVYEKKYSGHRVVSDSILFFKIHGVDEESKLQKISRDILQTISKRKCISEKQKKVLVKMLVRGEASNYEAKYGF